MRNRFFETALAHAAHLAGKSGRLLKLVTQLFFKLSQTNLSGKLWKQQALLLGRLVTAYARRRYRLISIKSFLSVVAALLYFVNPLDLVPDALVGVGLADDVTIITWIFTILKDELKAFEKWEAANELSEA